MCSTKVAVSVSGHPRAGAAAARAAAVGALFVVIVGVLLLLAEFRSPPPRQRLTLILSVTTSISHFSCCRCHLIVAELTDKKYQSKF